MTLVSAVVILLASPAIKMIGGDLPLTYRRSSSVVIGFAAAIGSSKFALQVAEAYHLGGAFHLPAESMSPVPARSRSRKLLIAFAITALVVATIHIAEFCLTGESFLLGRIGSSARPFFGNQPPNYSKIEDGLWMGGYVDHPPAGTQAVPRRKSRTQR